MEALDKQKYITARRSHRNSVRHSVRVSLSNLNEIIKKVFLGFYIHKILVRCVCIRSKARPFDWIKKKNWQIINSHSKIFILSVKLILMDVRGSE